MRDANFLSSQLNYKSLCTGLNLRSATPTQNQKECILL